MVIQWRPSNFSQQQRVLIKTPENIDQNSTTENNRRIKFSVLLYPGDVCTLLKGVGARVDTNVCSFYVNRFWRSGSELKSNCISWHCTRHTVLVEFIGTSIPLKAPKL